MNDKIRDNIIATIRDCIPEKENLTNFLSDTLNIGRESAYRRVRGEINFTFDEVIKLSQTLNFSIDNIIGIKKNENALFNIHMLKDMDYIDIYVNKMIEYGAMFRSMSERTETKARISANTLPYFFHIGYKTLSKFRIFKWLYQNQKIPSNNKFVDFILPQKVLEAHDIFHKDIQTIKNITFIMDSNVFRTVAKDIVYFYKRGLLSESDVDTLKAELHDIINKIEKMATSGFSPNNAKLDMYISAVDFEASYLHFEFGDHQFSQVRIFSISAIDSFNVSLCKIQKEWIESLKRYSVLISESGEMQRFEYMNKQREIIDRISK